MAAVTVMKRVFDLALALLLVALLALPFTVLLIWLLLKEGRPVFYVSERMRAPNRPFMLWKLRTMRLSRVDSGVSGGDKSDRITPMGRRLRKYRADEIPQLWNVIKGDMSFVGPRPPLRQYVERFPALYAEVLACRPGITGLATLYFHRHEEKLLKDCKTVEETDQTYARRCVPRKAKLDLIYRDKRNICFDIKLMFTTLVRVTGSRRGR